MLLTDEEIMDINQNAEFDSAIGYARKIESAVLEKLKSQEPLGTAGDLMDDYVLEQLQIKSSTPLYLHPLPPADVVQKYEELLYAVHRKFPDETRHQTALRYIKTAESPSYTNAAMKEMK